MSHKRKQRGILGTQFAALPVKNEGGETYVMLVTSRDTGRWVLPKGWAEKRLSGPQLAAKEAYEEAGVRGETVARPLGAYHYQKRLPDGAEIECTVEVFSLKVTEQLKNWPEAKQRRREWFTLPQAAMKVAESELAALFLSLAVHPRAAA